MLQLAAPRSVGILKDLVGFDTTSRNSNLALISHVEAFFAARASPRRGCRTRPARKPT